MKGILSAAGIALMMMTVLLACSSPGSSTTQSTGATIEPTGLPSISLMPEEGESFSTASLPGNTILIFFSSDCDHCQREATAFHDHIKAFDAYTIYFISMDEFTVMHKFADTYGLSGLPNVLFMKADGKSVIDALGDVSTPTICIYNLDKKLVKRFNGETEMTEILPVL